MCRPNLIKMLKLRCRLMMNYFHSISIDYMSVLHFKCLIGDCLHWPIHIKEAVYIYLGLLLAKKKKKKKCSHNDQRLSYL